MFIRLRTPLAIAVALAVAGIAHADSAQTAGTFGPASLDAKYKPCDDFYDYVNAK